MARRRLQDGAVELAAVGDGPGEAVVPGPLHPLGVEVEAEHRAAAGRQQLGRDLTDKAETDHAGPVAQLGYSPSHPLEGDGTHGGGGRCLLAAAGGDLAHEVPGHAHQFGVVGIAGAGAGDQVARSEIGDVGGDGHHLTGERIPDVPALVVEVTGRAPVGRRGDHPELQLGQGHRAARLLLGVRQHDGDGRLASREHEDVVHRSGTHRRRAHPPAAVLVEHADEDGNLLHVPADPDGHGVAGRDVDALGQGLVAVRGRVAVQVERAVGAGLEDRRPRRRPRQVAHLDRHRRHRRRRGKQLRRPDPDEGPHPLRGLAGIAQRLPEELQRRRRIAKVDGRGRGALVGGHEGGQLRPGADQRIPGPDEHPPLGQGRTGHPRHHGS